MKPPLSVTPLPNRGLRLDLAPCWKLPSFPADRDFWMTENQELLMDYLGEFLPRATPDGQGGVLYQLFEGGREIASQARPLMMGDALPAIAMERLRRALDDLAAASRNMQRRKAQRLLLQAFRLPDPDVDGEFYWVHGPPDDLRLIILWGVEREPNTSLPPMLAAEKLPVLPASPPRKGKQAALLLLGLAAAGGAALFGRRAMEQWEAQQSRPAIVAPTVQPAVLPAPGPRSVPEMHPPSAAPWPAEPELPAAGPDEAISEVPPAVPKSPAPPAAPWPVPVSLPVPPPPAERSVSAPRAAVPVAAGPPGSQFKPGPAPASAMPRIDGKSGAPQGNAPASAAPLAPGPPKQGHKSLLDKLAPK